MQEIDLEFYEEHKKLDRGVLYCDSVISFFLFNNLGKALFQFSFIAVLMYLLTSKLREAIDSTWIYMFTLFGIIVLFSFFGWLVMKLAGRIIFGQQVFGRLGGGSKRAVYAVSELLPYVKIELSAEDKQKFRDFSLLAGKLLYETLKFNYMKINREENGELKNNDSIGSKTEVEDLEKKWDEIWKGKILKKRFGKYTFEDLHMGEHPESLIISGALLRSRAYTGFFATIFWLVLIYCVHQYLGGNMNLHLVIQIGVSLGLVLAALWYLLAMFIFRELNLFIVKPLIPTEIQRKMEKEIKEFTNQSLTPISIYFSNEYYKQIRKFETSTVFRVRAITATGVALLIFLSWCLIYFIDSSFGMEVLNWHVNYAIGVVIIFVSLPLCFYIFSFVLQYLTHFLAPIGIALIGAISPFAIAYLITGQIDYADITDQKISAAIGGVVGLLSTAIPAGVKEALKKDKTK